MVDAIRLLFILLLTFNVKINIIVLKAGCKNEKYANNNQF